MTVKIGPLTFEGDSPYELPPAHSAIARAVGETVEILLTVNANVPEGSLLIRPRLTARAAKQLLEGLLLAANQAEDYGKRRGS